MPLAVTITATGTGTETATVAGVAAPTNTVRIYAAPIVDETPLAATPVAGLLAAPWVQIGIRVNSGSVSVVAGDDIDPGEFWIVAVEQETNTASAQVYTILAETTAEQILIANALAIAINNRSWSETDFLAAAAMLPRFETANLATLRVSVIPIETIEINLSRAMRQRDHTIQIGIAKKLDLTPTAAIRPGSAALASAVNPLLSFVESILDYFTDTDHARQGPGISIDVQNTTLFDAAKLHTDQIYMSVLTLKYRTYK